MIEIGAITLYREKSTVHRFSSGSGDQNGEPALMIRSNRVVIPIKTRVENIRLWCAAKMCPVRCA